MIPVRKRHHEGFLTAARASIPQRKEIQEIRFHMRVLENPRGKGVVL